MSQNYTGPVMLIPFIGDKDQFVLTIHMNDDDTSALSKIVKRYSEDGYKPDFKHIRRAYKENGQLVERKFRLGPVAYPSRSAFIRA